MSIVLVIIGLIIGGILKGQEIIRSAREKAVANEINAVRSATNTYFDRFRALPGDDPSAATHVAANVVNGNGNGIIGASPGATTALLIGTAQNAGENYQFFNGLLSSGLLNGGSPTPAATLAGTAFGTSALPAAPLTGTGLEVVYGEHTGLAAGDATDVTQTWLLLIKNPAGPASAVSPHVLADIDVTTDDGSPDTGGVRGDGTNGAGHCESAAPVAGNTYELQDATACIGIFAVTQ